MKIEVGDYIRTREGKIDKVINDDYYMSLYIECEKGLVGKRVTTFDGHTGIVIKHFKPTGRDMTVHIRENDGRIWYCPDYEIKEIF